MEIPTNNEFNSTNNIKSFFYVETRKNKVQFELLPLMDSGNALSYSLSIFFGKSGAILGQ
jgi:hypothetical protein